jgi:hypothetical protein
MSHISQPSDNSDTRCLIESPIQAQTLILLSSALMSDRPLLPIPRTLDNLSVCRHMIPDHVRIAVRVSSSPEASPFECVLRGVPADP